MSDAVHVPTLRGALLFFSLNTHWCYFSSPSSLGTTHRTEVVGNVRPAVPLPYGTVELMNRSSSHSRPLTPRASRYISSRYAAAAPYPDTIAFRRNGFGTPHEKMKPVFTQGFLLDSESHRSFSIKARTTDLQVCEATGNINKVFIWQDSRLNQHDYSYRFSLCTGAVLQFPPCTTQPTMPTKYRPVFRRPWASWGPLRRTELTGL